MKKRSDNIPSIVLSVAQELFFREGYSNITTEVIAQKAGISKKTLYHYFNSKNEILDKVINEVKKSLTNEIYGILLKDDLSYPDKLKKIITSFCVALSSITTTFLSDVQKNLPETWKQISEFKRDTVINHFGMLYDEGVKKGHINKNVNKHLTLLVLMSSIENLFDPNFLRQLPPEMLKHIPNTANEIFDAFVKVIYEGILTEETKEQYII